MTGAARPWLPRWRVEHARWTTGLLGILIGVAILLPASARPGMAAQVGCLVVAVALFGVPHGALDPLVGERWLAPLLGRRWWAPFHLGYLALVALVLVAWTQAPAPTLTVFLAASALHFGLGDVVRARAPRGLAWLEVTVRGAAPIVVPALAHPAAVREAFAWVAAGAPDAAIGAIVSGTAACARWLVIPGCAALAVAHLAAARHARMRAALRPSRARTAAAQIVASRHRIDALECLAVPALAVVLPPFVSFVVYFCALHSARHTLTLAAALDPTDTGRAWTAFARAALPATAVTLLAATVAWLVLMRVSLTSAPAVPVVVRVVFAGLAALTAPHMLLTALAGDSLAVGRSAALAPGPVQLVPQRPDRDA